MNANQVVIVMDREMLDVFLPVIGNTDYLESLSDRDLRKVSAAEDAMYDAIKRDPDELVERIARAIAAGAKSNCFERLDTGLEIRRVEQQCDRYRKQANAVLHALQEGASDEG